ncbi:MAG: VCBS repeat-containing protein, partial [Calditrichaeota bacterium]
MDSKKKRYGFLLVSVLLVFVVIVFYKQVVSDRGLNARALDFFQQMGAEVTSSQPVLPRAAGAELWARRMQVRLDEQLRKGLLSAQFIRHPARKPVAGQFRIFADDFEGPFPSENWQTLGAAGGGKWGKSRSRVFSGSYAAWCGESLDDGTQNGDCVSPENTLTWMIAGPFDLSGVKHAFLSFYASVETGASDGLFFFGVSADGKTFRGVGVNGLAPGWDRFELSDRDPELAETFAAGQVWIGFMFASTAGKPALGVFLDDVMLSREQGWSQEFGAKVSGRMVANFYSGGIGLARPALADIDADGDLDLFVGEYDGTINFYRNDGSAEHPDWTLVDCFYGGIDVGDNSSPALGDLDLDGDLDLLVGRYDGRIEYFRNDGSVLSPLWNRVGRLRDSVGNIIDAGDMSAPALVDIDADGDLDLFVGNAEGNLLYYTNQPNGLEANWVLKSKRYMDIDAGSLTFPAFTDIDGDGDVDLFFGTQLRNIMFLANQGNPTAPKFELMTKTFELIEVGRVTAPVFADWDNDDDPDLLVGSARGDLFLFANEGTSSEWRFQPVPDTLASQTFDVGFQSSPNLLDADGDGDLDLIVGSDSLYFFRNDGGAGEPDWRRVKGYFSGVPVKNGRAAAFVDIDADGDIDLFQAGKLGRLVFYRNDGNRRKPRWHFVTDYYDSLECGTIAFASFADVDSDGDFDLLMGSENHGICYFENVGSARQARWQPAKQNVIEGYRLFTVKPVCADIDGDGDLDLLVGGHHGTVMLFENRAQGAKPRWVFASDNLFGFKVRLFSRPALGDLDHDGDLDLLL